MTDAAVIMPDTLQAVGMKYLLSKYLEVSADTYSSVQEFVSSGSQASVFITDTATLAGSVDFFLPRRKRTIVVGCNSGGGDMEFVRPDQPVSDVVDTLGRFLASCSSPPPEVQRTDLSSREIQVLSLVAAGCINKEIADRLGISLNTVLSHRKNIMAKLGIRSTSGLSIFAMMNGIIEPPSNY